MDNQMTTPAEALIENDNRRRLIAALRIDAPADEKSALARAAQRLDYERGVLMEAWEEDQLEEIEIVEILG